jgi:hypothetical protein
MDLTVPSKEMGLGIYVIFTVSVADSVLTEL